MSDSSKAHRVAVVGLSIEGIDTVRYFLKQGKKVIGCDRRDIQELGSSVSELGRMGAVLSCGETYGDVLPDVDLIVRSPGIHPDSDVFRIAKEKGISFTTQTNLFFDACKAPIIGVTGTKGKGTTSTLIYEIIKAAGKKCYLGGNVGTPLLSQVDDITHSDVVVLELSSFQLEDCRSSPHIAVVLKITEDHLENNDANATNFHVTRETYIEAKKSIVKYQTEKDYVIVNVDDPISSSFAKLTPATVKTFSRFTNNTESNAFVRDHSVFVMKNSAPELFLHANDIKVRGDHNLENICAAILAASCIGIPPKETKPTIQTFEGLPYRLEFIRSVDGVSYYNDSFSTVPETAIAALSSFTEPVILILGGSEKKSHYEELAKQIALGNVKACIVIGQTADRIIEALTEAGYEGVIERGLTTMHDVVVKGKTLAKTGDVVLLSPACASFGMFKNYKDRGNQFNYEVSSL